MRAWWDRLPKKEKDRILLLADLHFYGKPVSNMEGLDKYLTNAPSLKDALGIKQIKKGNFVWIKEPFFDVQRLGKVVEVRRHGMYWVNIYGFDYSDKEVKAHEVHINYIIPVY